MKRYIFLIIASLGITAYVQAQLQTLNVTIARDPVHWNQVRVTYHGPYSCLQALKVVKGDGLTRYIYNFQAGTTQTIYYYFPATYNIQFSAVSVPSMAMPGCVTPQYPAPPIPGPSPTIDLTRNANGYGCCDDQIMAPGINASNPLNNFGDFALETFTGEFVFLSNDPECLPNTIFSCLKVDNSADKINGIISTYANTLQDVWDYNMPEYPFIMNDVDYVAFDNNYSSGGLTDTDIQRFENHANSIERGEANKWRVNGSYTYVADLDETIINTPGNPDDYKMFDRGAFQYVQFDWDNVGQSQNFGWVKTSTITHTSPDGMPLEEVDPLGRRSAALFTANNRQLSAVAQNAGREAIFYQSYENYYENPLSSVNSNRLENGHVLDQGTSLTAAKYHTGKQSVALNAANGTYTYKFTEGDDPYVVSEEVLNNGIVINIWINAGGEAVVTQNDLHLWVGKAGPSPSSISWISSAGVDEFDFRVKACINDWCLIEAEVPASFIQGNNFNLSANSSMYLALRYRNTTSDPGLRKHLDDVKIQPMNSSMLCYVYDEAGRIAAEFSDQHFAKIFQYAPDGSLKRILTETERGVQTVSEGAENQQGITNWQ